ncbi:glycosyltransferase [Stenotrophomonas sp. C3(2023)]|uniref:glycosyltransferase n=1 Tax=Stenotrophomonas sp. C3(2023) TaxID=3080277 RepID=UPI00293C6FCE|nr:glycosyltransferase [Stenotrophomonas sp. C3(2023)]MDV3468595.1 glycosyltransferase [Stenotrophomonas sp. C3(2023)]
MPAHNEADTIAACLRSVRRAARHRALGGEAVRIVVALDSCTDATGAVCERFGVMTLPVQARNVGAARAAAAAYLLAQGARWLSCTDADSRVPDDWLVGQLAHGSDVFCGLVDLDPASAPDHRLEARFHQREQWGDAHGRIHGANLGISAQTYRATGGFAPLRCAEDVDLVGRAIAGGASVCWAASPVVLTSARLQGRAVGGFADFLAAIALPVPALTPEAMRTV